MLEDATLQVMDAAKPGSPEWLAARRNGLGASEAGAVLGVDPHKSAAMLWLEKIGKAPARVEDTIAQKVGRFVEPAIAELFAAEHNTTLVRVPSRRSASLSILWASADRMAVKPLPVQGATITPADWIFPVEIKNRGGWPDGWGDDGTDVVPEAIAAQVHLQMHAYGLAEARVAVILSGNDFRTYKLFRDERVETDLLSILDDWWKRHVVGGVEPELRGPGLSDYMKARFQQASEKVTPLPGTDPAALALRDLFDVRSQIAALDEAEERLAAIVKAKIGETKGIETEYGKATWSTTKPSKVIDWESAARAIAQMASDNSHAGASAADILAAVVERFTSEKPGHRRFLPTPRKA